MKFLDIILYMLLLICFFFIYSIVSMFIICSVVDDINYLVMDYKIKIESIY